MVRRITTANFRAADQTLRQNRQGPILLSWSPAFPPKGKSLCPRNYEDSMRLRRDRNSTSNASTAVSTSSSGGNDGRITVSLLGCWHVPREISLYRSHRSAQTLYDA